MLDELQEVYHMLGHSVGLMDDTIERAKRSREAYRDWEEISQSHAFRHLPMMLRTKDTGEVAAATRVCVDDLLRPASVIHLNETAFILIPVKDGEKPREFVAVR